MTFLLLIFFLGIKIVFAQNPIVTLPSGQIAGTVLQSRSGKNFYAFRGVRYAQPPVGKLRFKPPVPVEPWEGVYDATNDIRSCSQPGYYVADSEDCLFLNVYTRRINGEGELRPVMVWIHGGGFHSNSAESWALGPDYIMDNDVVLVTFNYRLATLGFLSTGDQYSPGNYGMKDQVAVLRWLQKNINYFGGDPNKVTLAGESAGSVSVILHLVSPMSRGLFHRAIAQSGSALNTWAVNKNPLSLARTQADLLSCPTDTSENIVNCIKQYPAQQVSDVYYQLWDTLGWNGDPIVILSPVVETIDDGSERFLVQDPLISLQEGDFANVPLIIGITKDEFASKAVRITQNESLAQDMSANWNRIAPIAFIYEPNDCISSRLRQYYLGSTDQPITSASFERLGQIYADALIIFGTVRAAKLIAEKNSQPVYLYEFNYQGQYSFGVWPGTNQPIGVLHGDDLIYLYYISPYFPKLDTTSEDGQFTTRLTTLWSNFIEFGNPTPEPSDELNNVIWSPFTATNPSYLDINKNLTLVKGLYYQDRISFWENLVPLKQLYLEKI